jgi:hypothetical protein
MENMMIQENVSYVKHPVRLVREQQQIVHHVKIHKSPLKENALTTVIQINLGTTQTNVKTVFIHVQLAN